MNQQKTPWGPPVRHCNECGAPIYWAILREDTRAIDARPHEEGNILLHIRNRTLRAGFVDHNAPPPSSRNRYLAHSVTCTPLTR